MIRRYPSLVLHAIRVSVVCLIASAPVFAAQTFIGKFQYQDREFNLNGFTGVITPRPIRFADIRIVSGDVTLATGATQEDGSFTITAPDSDPQSLRAICISASTNTPQLRVEVRVANNDYSFGDFYSVASAPQASPGTGAVNFGTTIATADIDVGKAFNIWDVANDALEFVASPEVNGSLPDKKLSILWRFDHPKSSAFYDPDAVDRYVYIGSSGAYDDTIISHEIGHFIDDIFSRSDSPGGTHYLGDDDQDIRLSWAEGLATFLGSSMRRFKGYARPDIMVKTDGSFLSYSFENESLTGNIVLASRTGSTNEVAVTAALWDIVDGPFSDDIHPGDDDDPLERSFTDVWKVLHRYLPTITRPGISIENFWDGWFSPQINNGFQAEMESVFSVNNGIEFIMDSQEPDDTPYTAPLAMIAQSPALLYGPVVLINELELGLVDAVELYNAGDLDAELAGWTVESSARGKSTTTYTIPPYRLPPGGFLILSEASGTNTETVLFFGENISWSNGNPGACILSDRNGTVVDSVSWRTPITPAHIEQELSSTEPASPPAGKTLGRDFAGTNTSAASDWTAQDPTFGTYNAGSQEKHHTYYPESDEDWLILNATSDSTYLIETLNLFNGADTVLDIVAPDGITVLDSNDDYWGRQASRLNWTAPSSGSYFIRSRQYQGPRSYPRYGSYNLRVTETAGSAPPSGSLLTVSRPGQGGIYQSLSEALQAAGDGDTIELLDNAIYYENVLIAGKRLTLQAAAGKNPVINGRIENSLPAIRVVGSEGVRISGITFHGGPQGIVIADSSVTIVNSIVAGISDPEGAADGIRISGINGKADIINCTIVNNGRFGVSTWDMGSVKIINTIFDNNALDDYGGDGSAVSTLIRNSLIDTIPFIENNGNFGGDPQFLDPANNFRLQAASPAIDKGDPLDPDLPMTDADGIPRSLDGLSTGNMVPDMGAYEYLPPALLTSTGIFPQFAAGGTQPEYRTSLIAFNSGVNSAIVNISLTQFDGRPLAANIMNCPESPPDFSSNGSPDYAPIHAFNLPIAPMGTARIDSSGTDDLEVGYAKVLSNIPVRGTSIIKMLKENEIQSEAAVSFSKAATNFMIYVDNRNNALTSYAIANPGEAPAHLILILRDENGTLVESSSLVLDPGRQIAEFASQRFPIPMVHGFEGSIELTSDQEVTAVAFRLDNPELDVLSSFPLLVNETATTHVLPLAADGGGYRTVILLMNPSTMDADVTLDFFGGDGNGLALPIEGVDRMNYTIEVKAHGVSRVVTDGTSEEIKAGWILATSPVAIGGSLVLQSLSGTGIMSEAHINAFSPSQRFATFVESADNVASGIALCNPNSSTVSFTMNLRAASGQVVTVGQFTLPPFGRAAKFLNGPGQWFSGTFDEFAGILEIIASKPLSGSTVRYDNYGANVFTALPLVTVP